MTKQELTGFLNGLAMASKIAENFKGGESCRIKEAIRKEEMKIRLKEWKRLQEV